MAQISGHRRGPGRHGGTKTFPRKLVCDTGPNQLGLGGIPCFWSIVKRMLEDATIFLVFAVVLAGEGVLVSLSRRWRGVAVSVWGCLTGRGVGGAFDMIGQDTLSTALKGRCLLSTPCVFYSWLDIFSHLHLTVSTYVYFPSIFVLVTQDDRCSLDSRWSHENHPRLSLPQIHMWARLNRVRQCGGRTRNSIRPKSTKGQTRPPLRMTTFQGFSCAIHHDE